MHHWAAFTGVNTALPPMLYPYLLLLNQWVLRSHNRWSRGQAWDRTVTRRGKRDAEMRKLFGRSREFYSQIRTSLASCASEQLNGASSPTLSISLWTYMVFSCSQSCAKRGKLALASSCLATEGQWVVTILSSKCKKAIKHTFQNVNWVL